MTSIGRIFSLAGTACLVAAPLWAADGVLIVQKTTMGSAPAETHQIQIEPKRMRMEAGGMRGGGKQVVIFDGTREVMLMIDDTNKSYSEMTKADMDAIGGQMAGAMAQMQEAMKNLTPEQRAQMQAAMGGRGAGRGMPGMGAAPARPTYKKTGTDTVGKWTCDKYEGYNAEGQKTSEVCTVDPKVLGFTAADFAVTNDMAAFFQKLMPNMAMQSFRIGSAEDQGFSGVPVRSVMTVGTQTVTSEITDVRRQAFPDSTFQVPAGYQKQDSPFGAMGRGRRGGGGQ
jgi:uncharacterized protein DUF4412